MLVSLFGQILLFIGSLLAGVIIGLMFEAYKLMIKDLRKHKFTLGFMDILFWVLAGICIYFWLLLVCGAIINAYVLLLIIIGLLFYYFILSPVIGEYFGMLIYNFVSILMRIIKIMVFPLEIIGLKIFKKTKR